MRIDPDAVYLELSEALTVYNFGSGDTRTAPAAILHWKDGRKWQRRSFIANENNGDTLGAILARIGAWLDEQGSLDAAFQTIARTPIERPAA